MLSFGISLHEVVTCTKPYVNMKHITDNIIGFEEKLRNGLRPTPPASPSSVNDLIELCWRTDPKQRPSMEIVCETILLMKNKLNKYQACARVIF